MPELPEVEIFRRYVAENALRRPVVAIDSPDTFVRREVSERRLRSALVGSTFASTRRHGKWLFLEARASASGDRRPPTWLVLHFGMTGAPVVVAKDASMPRFPRFAAEFADGGRLVLDDARRLGGVALAATPDEWVASRHLGPDALDAPREDVVTALRRRRGRLKPLLLDQTMIAGVGNVYADEILFRARLHPLRRIDELGETGVRHLAETVQEVLGSAVDLRALFHLMPDDWLVRHRAEGEPCPSCAGTVARITLAGRSTYFCPSCQQL